MPRLLLLLCLLQASRAHGLASQCSTGAHQVEQRLNSRGKCFGKDNKDCCSCTCCLCCSFSDRPTCLTIPFPFLCCRNQSPINRRSGNHGAMSTNVRVNQLMGLCDDLIGGSSLMWRYHHQVQHRAEQTVKMNGGCCLAHTQHSLIPTSLICAYYDMCCISPD